MKDTNNILNIDQWIPDYTNNLGHITTSSGGISISNQHSRIGESSFKLMQPSPANWNAFYYSTYNASSNKNYIWKLDVYCPDNDFVCAFATNNEELSRVTIPANNKIFQHIELSGTTPSSFGRLELRFFNNSNNSRIFIDNSILVLG